MTDPLDVDLQDSELIAEIQLVADLMVAASEAGEHMPQSRIDAILETPAPAGGLTGASLPTQRRAAAAS